MKVPLNQDVVLKMSVSRRPELKASANGKTSIVYAPSDGGEYITYDSSQNSPRGFGVRVGKTGKSSIVQRAINGKVSKWVVGKVGDLTIDEARDKARERIQIAAMEQKGVRPAMVAESVEVLELQGYVETLKAVGGGFKPCGLTTRGVSLVLGAEEAPLIRDVGFAIINDGLRRSDAIAETIGQPEPLIHHALGLLSRDGYLSLSGEISLMKSITFVKPTLRRMLGAEI